PIGGASGNPDRHNTTKNSTTPQKKGGAAATALPLPTTHVSPGRSQSPETGIPTCVGKTLQVFSTTFRNWVHPHMRGEQVARSGPDHPHVRGADVHEPSGAA